MGGFPLLTASHASFEPGAPSALVAVLTSSFGSQLDGLIRIIFLHDLSKTVKRGIQRLVMVGGMRAIAGRRHSLPR
jgi:hypothetical protein